MINILYRSTKDAGYQKLDEFKVGSWILAEECSKSDMKKIESMLPVNHDLMKDALDPYEVPRIEQEEGVTYVFTRAPFKDQDQTSTTPVLIVIGEDFVLTVTLMKTSFIEKFLEKKVDFYTTQKAKLFFQLFFEINMAYNSFLTDIRKEMNRFSVNFSHISNKDIVRFVSFENTHNEFLSALIPTDAVLERLLSGKYFSLYKKDKDLVEDLLLSIRQLIELGRSNLKSISNIREAYSTIMTNNLNRVIKLLTALTIVFTIPTMVSSFFGMNVPLPLDGPGAFGLIFGGTIALSVAILIIFAKKDWI